VFGIEIIGERTIDPHFNYIRANMIEKNVNVGAAELRKFLNSYEYSFGFMYGMSLAHAFLYRRQMRCWLGAIFLPGEYLGFQLVRWGLLNRTLLKNAYRAVIFGIKP